METNTHSGAFLRGVNLGGWLALEKWITPSLFAGTDATDEYTFMQTPDAAKKLDQHRRSFVVEEDFRWLHDNGINAVRIPVGYWIFDGDVPFAGGVEYLDWAVEMAEKYQLKVLIDLHGAKGSQNGNDHSGRVGKSDWYHYREYREQTIDALERLARRYYGSATVWGIELLNEPKPGLLQCKLRRFYKEAYLRLRQAARPGTHIVFHDAFRPRLLAGALRSNEDHPVAMDVHWYQVTEPFQKWRRLEAYFRRLLRRPRLINHLQKHQPIIVGEWSIVLSQEVLQGQSADEREAALRRHGKVQMDVYSHAAGWFYWTYKTERRDTWNFRALLEDGRLDLH